MNRHAGFGQDRPWIKSYPEGVRWDADIATRPVHEQVLERCAQTPEAPALDFLGKTTRYGAMGRQIRALAGALQTDLGLKKGERVALLMPNTPFFVIAYYAVLAAGGTVVNCNPLYTVSELEHIVTNSGARIAVTLDLKLTFEQAETLVARGHIQHLVTAHFPDALPGLSKLMFSLAKRADLANANNSKAAPSIAWWHDLVSKKRAPQPVPLDPETDVAVQQYTGGTTGVPKGAMLTHANIAANTDQIDKWGDGLFYAPSKIVAVLPFFHIFAMTVCMNAPLCSGAQVVMLPRFEIGPFIKLVKRTRANVLPAVPTLLHALALRRQASAQVLAPIEVVISGGAGLPEETRTAFAEKSDAILAEGYGLTEASPVVTCASLRDTSRPGSIGLPLPGTDVKFLDLEDPEKQLETGEKGELAVKGPQVMLGYDKDPEATQATFTKQGYLRTADVGYCDEDGYVFLVDRIKDLIICSGFNVYPRVIEDAILKHEAVEETSVIGVSDPYRGEAPVAYVSLRPDAALTARELLSFLREHLSKTEMPREIVFRDTLPKTMIGKLSKNDLRDDYEQTQKQDRETGP